MKWRRRRRSPAAIAEPVPDLWQTGAMTLLLGLASLPLLMDLMPQIGIYVALLLLLRLASLRWPELQLGTWVLTALTLLGGLNVIDAYQSLAGRSPGTALLLTMVALKLLEVRRERDLRVLATVFGFLLVVQFLFDTSAAMVGYVGLLMLGIIALMADLSAQRTGVRLRPAVRSAVMLTIQALPLALVLFLLFPRLDAPLWDLGLDSGEARTGLKNWLEPGAISEVVISGENAFRARFDRPLQIGAESMYWRGPVLWHTDGRRWMPLSGYRWPPQEASVEPLSEPLHYTVIMEPSDQRWLMTLDMPVAIPDRATLTSDFQVLAERPVDELRVYRASSALEYRTQGLGAADRVTALQLPNNITPRMRALVAGWTSNGADPMLVVQRALAHFNGQPFRYTLMPPPLGQNVADAFLFETKSGFCEHYASSFVLLMRIAGIPARVVAGYLGGEHNPISDDYLVRQSDAHAWSEVWIADRGWVRVDPTAAVAAERVERDGRVAGMGASAPVRFRLAGDGGLGRLIQGLRLVADAVDAGWTNWVVGFSGIKQQRMLDGLGLGHLHQYGLALLMAGTGMAVMIAWSLALARRRPPADPVVRAWGVFSRKMAGVGLSPRAVEGPLDYRKRILDVRPDLASKVDAIVNAYLGLHYGKVDPASVDALQALINDFHPRQRRRM